MNASPSKLSIVPPAPSRSTLTTFDHEKLDVYQLELRFIAWVTPLIEEAKNVAAGKTREVCDQLDRASLSSLLNTAEGNGKRRGQVRAKFFDDARGSATECAGCLDALVAKSVFTRDRIAEGKTMLLRIVSMLCRLVDRFDQTSGSLHEDVVEYRISPEVLPESRKRTRTRTRTNNTV
jgi:four helix bundle protein